MGNTAQCCCSNKDGTGPNGSEVMVSEQAASNGNPGFEAKQEMFNKSPDKSGGGKDDSPGRSNEPAAAAASKEYNTGCGDVAAGTGGSDGEQQQVTYEDESTYLGQLVNGKRHGNGMWKSKTGQYEGQWSEDSQHGQGRQSWSDGRVYEGQFANGRFSGKGRMVWHTQKGELVYDGDYLNDLKHGVGKFSWADGRTYDGEWQLGKRHGKGVYMNSKFQKKVGFWHEDKFKHWENDGGDNAAQKPLDDMA